MEGEWIFSVTTYCKTENDVLFSNDTGKLRKRNSECSCMTGQEKPQVQLPRASEFCSWASENGSLVARWASETSLSSLVSDNSSQKQLKNLRRLTTVFLALGWIFSNQYLAWKACFDFHHTSPTFQPMIKFYVLVGFQATAVTIATVTQSTSFWITPIISKSSQTLGNETFRI